MTTGNDTVDGSTVVDSISGDSIVDSSTTDADTLNAVITANTAATITNVETSNIDFKGFNLTFDAASVSSGKIVAKTTQEFNTSATITNLSSKGATVEVGTGITTLVLGGSTANTDSTSVKLAGGNLALTTNSANAIETVALNSTGTAANVVTLTNAAAAETFNVSGDKSLTLKVAQANITGDTVTKALTGDAKLTVELTTAAATADLKKVAADTFTTASSGNTAFGAAVTFAAGTTNFEVNDATVLTALTGVLTADGTATTDVLNLKLNKAGAGTNQLATAGFETVNITSNTGADVTLNAVAHTFGVDGNVTIAGSTNFDFGATPIVAKGVDASAMTGTGTLTVSVANNATNSITVKGTANADTITVAQTTATKTATVDAGNGNNTVSAATATAGVSITTGTGNDTITSGTGNDTIQSGEGNDTITATTGAGNHIIIAGAGNDTLAASLNTGAIFANMGAGDDLVNVGDNLLALDTIVGGVGSDTLVIGNLGAVGTYLDNVSGFETITLANTAANTYTTKDTLVDAGAKLTVTQSGAFALTWNGSAETDGTFDITAGGAANHTLTGGAGADVFTVNGAGNSSITGGKGADTITLTGAGAHVITQAKGDSLVITSVTAGMSLTGADVVKGTGLNAGDKVVTGNANIVAVNFSQVSANPTTLANDSAYLVKGDYNTTTKAFTASTGGADAVLFYDADSTSASQFEAIVLVGQAALVGSSNFTTAGTLTLA